MGYRALCCEFVCVLFRKKRKGKGDGDGGEDVDGDSAPAAKKTKEELSEEEALKVPLCDIIRI